MATQTTTSGNTYTIGSGNTNTFDVIEVGGLEIVSGTTISALVSGATQI